MASERLEWVEIVEPSSKNIMYANLTTGLCVWDPPLDVSIKKFDDNQWWELYDPNTSRFYYYNATSQKTVWHRPQNCDIIPLAKLQQIKQNTEVRGCSSDLSSTKESIGTQTTAKVNAQQTSPSPRRRTTYRHGHRRGSSSCSHQDGGARIRRSSQSSQGSVISKRESGRVSDSSMSRSRTSLECSSKGQECDFFPIGRDSNHGKNHHGSSRQSSQHHGLSSTTPCQRHEPIRGAMTKQHSFDVGNYKKRPEENLDGRRDMALSRSYSFMSRPKYYDEDERFSSPGLRSVESTPQAQRRLKGQLESSRKRSDSSGLDSIATPMTHRKQPNEIRHMTSDSSASPPSPRSNAVFDSRASTLTEKDAYAGRGSVDSSPQFDSGLVSGTTGSRGSADSGRTFDSRIAPPDARWLKGEVRRCGHHRRHHCSKHRQLHDNDQSDTLQSTSCSAQLGINNHQSKSSASSTATKQVIQHYSPIDTKVNADKIRQHKDLTHLYSNLDYVYDQPVYQYIMEQAKRSGNRLGDSMYEDGDSLHSDDSDGHDDSDEFADDEAMSNTSSQEYLDDVNYLADDETYTQFFMPSETKSQTKDGATGEDTRRETESLMTQLTIEQDQLTTTDIQYGSLRKKKEPAPNPPLQSRIQASVIRTPHSETDIEHMVDSESHLLEKYAEENLNVHTRGLLRKKVPVMDMISWTKDHIRKPMLVTIGDKSLKTQACEMFKLVQIYMSDRKPKLDMTLNSVGLDIVTMVYANSGLRDELYVQICRQTTENRNRDSLRRGWELLAICLHFLPPSEKFTPYLAGYIVKHCDSAYQTMYPEISKWPIHIQINHYAGVCSKRLERTSVNSHRQRLKKPVLEEIDLARLHIFRASMFGGTLEEVMALQKERYPHRRLPWVQSTLSEEALRLQGTNTEGIFRVPADFDEVNQLKQVVDQWEVGDCGDPHVVAALLKLWYRELYHPLIPDSLYATAIETHEQPVKAVALVNQLPEINRLVLSYLIRFLQYFSQADIVVATKMDANNLAMVMAPNCLRCMSDDPKIIYENTRKEMAFMRTLIQHLDTSFMEGIV